MQVDALLGAMLRGVAIGVQVRFFMFGRQLQYAGNEVMLTHPYSALVT